MYDIGIVIQKDFPIKIVKGILKGFDFYPLMKRRYGRNRMNTTIFLIGNGNSNEYKYLQSSFFLNRSNVALRYVNDYPDKTSYVDHINYARKVAIDVRVLLLFGDKKDSVIKTALKNKQDIVYLYTLTPTKRGVMGSNPTPLIAKRTKI